MDHHLGENCTIVLGLLELILYHNVTDRRTDRTIPITIAVINVYTFSFCSFKITYIKNSKKHF